MKFHWISFVDGSTLVAGDIVGADIERNGKNITVELCGEVPMKKKYWYITSNRGKYDNTMIHESQIRILNKDIDYYNRRIKLCDKYEKINNQQREYYETMKNKLIKSIGGDVNDKKYRVTF